LAIVTPPRLTLIPHKLWLGTIDHEELGTNISGPFSPTMYGVPQRTGQPVALPSIIEYAEVTNETPGNALDTEATAFATVLKIPSASSFRLYRAHNVVSTNDVIRSARFVIPSPKNTINS